MSYTLFSRRQVCTLFDITLDTLRHYENLNLIKPVIKENKYKYYSIEDIEVLNVILTFRSFNMPLSDINEIISCDDLSVYKSHLGSQINTIEAQIQNLERAKSSIVNLKNAIDEYENLKDKITEEHNLKLKIKLSNLTKDINKKKKTSNFNYYENKVLSFLTFKSVDLLWLNSNRSDLSNTYNGILCDTCFDKEIFVKNALSIYAFEEMSMIPDIVRNFRLEHGKEYEFTDYMIIIEINAFKCFNQGKLIRKIIFPYES